eukprot:4839316-Amphidinium_carterae.1
MPWTSGVRFALADRPNDSKLESTEQTCFVKSLCEANWHLPVVAIIQAQLLLQQNGLCLSLPCTFGMEVRIIECYIPQRSVTGVALTNNSMASTSEMLQKYSLILRNCSAWHHLVRISCGFRPHCARSSLPLSILLG